MSIRLAWALFVVAGSAWVPCSLARVAPGDVPPPLKS